MTQSVIRLFDDDAVLPRGGCPAHRRIRARAGGFPSRAPALDTLDTVLDLVEHRGWELDRACEHLPEPHWVHRAAAAYLRSVEPGSRAVPCFWVRQYIPDRGSRARPYELCARGRRYVRPGVRELRVPVPAPVLRTPPDARTAVAAYVLATGREVDRAACDADPQRYLGGVPFPMLGRREPLPRRVRVVEVSCLDSATAVRFDGTPAQAEALFQEVGREGLRSALAGGARVPGADCLDCGARRRCDRLPPTPGLLGADPSPGPHRTWSVSLGQDFRACPARARYRALGVPPAAPAHREDTVRTWLERLHGRLPRRPCEPADLPADPDRRATGHRPTGEEARRTAAMLAAHVPVCPLRGLPSGSHLRLGASLAADDTETGVLVLSRADVLHHHSGSWIHRSISTPEGDPPPQGLPLLSHDPRLALAVLLFASGVLPTGPASAVELEALTPAGAHLLSLDPSSPDVRQEARRVVGALAAPWLGADAFPATPGPACLTCPYARWCPAQRQKPRLEETPRPAGHA
ncbi:PD-(D/E)XK nuclease family protein [Nocardiopsis algeriensis]|uniref:PD-(D/E)XK nuclease family protein n=1 Tax=Nocardiopsis algeriensis TaxID=1478215 RepID=UPI003B42EC80